MLNNKRFIALFFFGLFILQGCTTGRMLYRNQPSVTDYRFLPKNFVQKSNKPARNIYASPQKPLDSLWVRPEIGLTRLHKILAREKVTALLAIRNDTILYEKYFQGYSDTSLVTSFSIAKSFTAALVGIAIGEGKIESANDPVIKYVPELANRKGMEKVTINHLVSMTSGLRFGKEGTNPFLEAAKIYYHDNLKKYLLERTEIEYSPGVRFRYDNGNTQLAALALERATGKKIQEYLKEKIWEPLGMESDLLWSGDGKTDGMVKAFCCMNARARDFARWGQLYMHGGEWNGRQIIPKEWVTRSLDPKFYQTPPFDYHNHWMVWSPDQKIMVIGGLYNQYIVLCPEKNLILALFASKPKQDTPFWRQILLQIADQL